MALFIDSDQHPFDDGHLALSLSPWGAFFEHEPSASDPDAVHRRGGAGRHHGSPGGSQLQPARTAQRHAALRGDLGCPVRGGSALHRPGLGEQPYQSQRLGRELSGPGHGSPQFGPDHRPGQGGRGRAGPGGGHHPRGGTGQSDQRHPDLGRPGDGRQRQDRRREGAQ